MWWSSSSALEMDQTWDRSGTTRLTPSPCSRRELSLNGPKVQFFSFFLPDECVLLFLPPIILIFFCFDDDDDGDSDKKVTPKITNDVKLISSGKILSNSQTIGQYRTPFTDLPGGSMTMHVVIQPSLTKAKTGHFISSSSSNFRNLGLNIIFLCAPVCLNSENKVDDMPKKTTVCSCTIL